MHDAPGPHPAAACYQSVWARGTGKPIAEVAKIFGIHRATVYRALAAPRTRSI
ncbi:helix-turn-helix domain-containing protein [Pseudomonas sp. 10-1B]|uniref:helix-turn-helix domain-containing protein n=1 Tax=Pseudomonas sp. 10-1B TaxID=1546029 RepID=UPI00128E8162